MNRAGFVKKPAVLCLAALLLASLPSCSIPAEKLPPSEAYLAAQDRRYANYSIAEDADVVFDAVPDVPEGGPVELPETEAVNPTPNKDKDAGGFFLMRVREKIDVYADPNAPIPGLVLNPGEIVRMKAPEDGSSWGRVEATDGSFKGYIRDGFVRAVNTSAREFAELPIEYGYAKTNQDTFVAAYSHLVDVTRYFRTVDAQDQNFYGINLDGIDLVIAMKLSTNGTSIGEPFYQRNLCLLQYDILPALKKAIEMFQKDGYTVVIFDAYRPTSVQQRWFDVVRVHKWVADPSIGMGGIHDRGTAIDMSLLDQYGNLVDMPTPMHTFTEESARTSPTMTETQRKNMDYMKDVMVACGFDYINSEWWHFQDKNTLWYLPTDHPLDDVPLISEEP